MKIFGRTRFNGIVQAATGSFGKFTLNAAPPPPTFYVAGSDTGFTLPPKDERSIVAQGLYDYVVYSDNTGKTFQQPGTVPSGSVMGYRVTHRPGTYEIYTLVTETQTNATTAFPKTRINFSSNAGQEMKNFVLFPNTKNPEQFYGFDMQWVSSTELYVVGATVTAAPVGTGTRVNWKKYSGFGRELFVNDAAYVPVSGEYAYYPAAYYSNDAGKTFTLLPFTSGSDIANPEDSITAVAVNPTDPNIVLYGTERGYIYRSTDKGRTPTLVHRESAIINRISFSENDFYCYAAVGGGFGKVIKSTNGGSTWQESTLTAGIRYQGSMYDVISPNRATVLAVGDDYKTILKSTDSGSSWTYKSSGIKVAKLPLIDIKGILRSGTVIGDYIALSKDTLFHKQGANKWIDTSFSSLLDWPTPLKANPNQEFIAFDFGQDVANKNVYIFILAAINDTAYEIISYNINGRNKTSSPLPSGTDKPVSVFARSHSEIYIVTENSGIIRAAFNTATSAFTFTTETSGTSEEIFELNGGKDGSTNTGNLLFAAGENGTVLYKNYTQSDPVTWSAATAPTDTGHGTEDVIQIQAQSDNVLYALTYDVTNNNSYVYKSTDGGATWGTPLLSNIGEKYTKFIVYVVSGNTIITCLNADGQKIISSQNDGSSWTTYTTLANPGSVALVQDPAVIVVGGRTPSTRGYILIAGARGIVLTDYGVQYTIGPWSDVPVSLVGITGKIGYPFWVCGGTTNSSAATDAGSTAEPYMLKSIDNGDTWEDVSTTLPLETKQGDYILTTLSEGVYTVFGDYDRLYIYGSDDLGKTFTAHDSKIYRLNKRAKTYDFGSTIYISDIFYASKQIGYAVGNGNVATEQQPNDTDKLAKTTDGGNTWNYISFPSNHTPGSIYFTSNTVGYVTAVVSPNSPDYFTSRSKVFKTNDGGTSWNVVHSFAPINISGSIINSPAGDVYFVDSNNGFATYFNSIVKTSNGGTTWSPIVIDPTASFFAEAANSKFSFATTQTGYVFGNVTFDNIVIHPAVYKTTNGGSTWSRVTHPDDNIASGVVSTGYYLTTSTAFICISYATAGLAKIFQTKNANAANPTWTELYTIQHPENSIYGLLPPVGITDMQFSKDGKIGVAVGYRRFYRQINSSELRDWERDVQDHFILLSLDGGDTWNEIDKDHKQVDLENYLNSQAFSGQKQLKSSLTTVAFTERRTLTTVTPPDPPLGPGEPDVNFDDLGPDDPVPPVLQACFDTKFLSASYYNLENFAYKCTAFDKDGNPLPPIYHPNVSENVGLGRNIFGQLSGTDQVVLKSNLTYGAALGVNAIGSAVYSKNDTAVGYGAMDLLSNANNNVAVGYKALSRNLPIAEAGSIIDSNLIGISEANVYTSTNGGLTWSPLTITASIATPSIANTTESILLYSDVISTSERITYILANDVDQSGSISNTYIFKSTDGNRSFDLTFTSSLYTVSKITALNDSLLFGLDNINGYVLKSPDGGYSWETGSIQSFSGNSVNNIIVKNRVEGFLVGTYIWSIQTGSNNWITSSYSGSHTLYDAVPLDETSWIAVGTSGSIYRTQDSGLNWSIVTQSLTTNPLNVVINSDGGLLIAAGVSGSIIYATGSGNTWITSSYSTTESFAGYNYTAKNTNIPGEITLYSSNGNVKSIDGGVTWAPVPSEIFQDDIITKISVNSYFNNQFSGLDSLTSGDTLASTQDLNSTEENVAVGIYSLGQHTNAWGMVGVGAKTFFDTSARYANITPNNGELILGNYYDFIEDGAIATARASNYGQIAIGKLSQANSKFTSFNTSVGYASMFLAEGSSENTAVGFYSQHLSNGVRNTSMGVWSLGINGNTNTAINYDAAYFGGTDNIAIGYKAHLKNISSIRANQIIRDVFGNDTNLDASYMFPLGSENIAIGNEAFLNVSGSNKTISIGHKANYNSYDITDSVFMGAYVGYNFKTPTGSYYNNAAVNDWKQTQTVGIGSYAIYNQTGTDIVAIGANALRGQRAGNAGTGLVNNGRYAVVLPGILEGMIYNTYDLSKDQFNFSGFPRKRSQQYWLLDRLGLMGLPPSNNCNQIKLQDINIVNKDVAYALYLKNEYLGADEKLQSFYPVLVKTDTLSNFATQGRDIIWDSIDHTDSNGFPLRVVKGTVALGPANSAVLSAPTEDVIYILSRGANYGIYKSIDGGTSFTTALDTRLNATFNNRILNSIQFSNALTGSVVGYPNVKGGILGRPFFAKTTNGASSWTSPTVDNTDAGLGVSLRCVWFNSNHTTGFVGGSHGSIYKTTDGGSTWTKLIGASHRTNFAGSVYSDFGNTAADKKGFVINDIYFINSNIGWAIGSAAIQGLSPANSKSYVLKTTDGGTTWTKVQLSADCTNIASPALQKVKAIDANIVYVASNFGKLYRSNDGGTTWDTSDDLSSKLYYSKTPVACPPVAINALAIFVDDSNLVDGGTGQAISYTSQSVAIGSEVQAKQQFVENNVAVGYKVQYNATGSALASVQIGANATINSNYVRDTVAVGKDSLNRTTYSDKTTAVGKSALYNVLQDPSKPAFPGVIVNSGGEPGTATSDSTINTAVGYQAGISLVMGDSNVFIGANSGIFNNPAFTTFGSNNINIGTDSPKYAPNASNQIAVGNLLHNFAVLWGQAYAPQPWRTQSDIRDKADTGSFTLGLNFIRELQPKQFKWDSRANYPSGSTPDGTYKQSGSSYGYIAQDIELAASAVGVSGSLFIVNTSGSYSGSSDPSGSDAFDLKLITPGMIDLVVVNAVKELDTTVSYLSASKYTTSIGNGSDTSYPVTHSLGTRDVIAMVYSNNTNLVVYPTMSIDSTNTMTITFPTVAMTNQYRLVVMR